MAIRLFQEITTSIQNFIAARLPGIAVRPTDPHSQLFINPVAAELDNINLELVRLNNKRSYANLRGEELDNYGRSVGIKRIAAQKAAGIIFVGTPTLPTQRLTLPLGSRFFGGIGNTLTYISTVEVSLPDQSAFANTPSESPFYYVDPTGVPYFGVRVPVEALLSGEQFNLDANSIKSKSSNLPTEFTFITNELPIEGGIDVQSDSSYIRLLDSLLLGGLVGNEEGLIRGILTVAPNVFDIGIIGIGDPLMTRDDGNGGKIDIVVVGTKNVLVTETFENVDTVEEIPLRFNPVTTIVSIVGQNRGVYPRSAFSLNQPTIPDPRAGTTKSKATISFNGTIPPLDTIEVTYSYNKTLYDLDQYLKKRSVLPGVDLLVRVGKRVNVNVSVTVKAVEGLDKSIVRSAVTNSLQLYLNSFNLGSSVGTSQISDFIKSLGENIVEVTLPLGNLSRDNSVSTTVIEIASDEYVRAGRIEVFVR